jgi:hypothetical protein
VTDANATLADALKPITTALGSDGYELAINERDACLELRIVATAGACEECLVPKEVMRMMVDRALQSAALGQLEIKLTYPTDT